MAWTCRININTDNAKVGSLSAVWNDPVLLEAFAYSEDQINTDSVAGFKARANAAKDAWVSRRTALAAKETQLTTFMNT